MAIKTSLFFITVIILSGCGRFVPGLLYTHTVQPHSIDFDRTAIGTKKAFIDEYSLSEPFTGLGLSVEWNANRIRVAAKEAGIHKIAFTEIETLSFLLGIYQRRRLIIHGE